MKLLVATTILSLLLSGCTTIISEGSRKLVDTDADFAQLKGYPERYTGKHIMLGGKIASVKNSMEGSQIEIVQFDLTSSGRPEETFISNGRFLATSSEYLDTMIFRRGMLITLVGEIKGKKIQRLDDMDYIYPVVALREWHLWPESSWDRGEAYPVPPPPYYPYYYGYGFEPYWYRPYDPIIRQK